MPHTEWLEQTNTAETEINIRKIRGRYGGLGQVLRYITDSLTQRNSTDISDTPRRHRAPAPIEKVFRKKPAIDQDVEVNVPVMRKPRNFDHIETAENTFPPGTSRTQTTERFVEDLTAGRDETLIWNGESDHFQLEVFGGFRQAEDISDPTSNAEETRDTADRAEPGTTVDRHVDFIATVRADDTTVFMRRLICQRLRPSR